MEKIKISIIVPAYNIAPYLPRCLDSILAQTYTNLEIIIVNDGSTDQTGEIIDNYAKRDSRILAIHQQNGGVLRARFTGLRAVTGEWVGFVDGDDYIEPDMYERLLNNALQYQADISHCGYRMVFPNRVDLYYGTDLLAEQDCLTGQYDLLDGSRIEPGLWNKLFHNTLLHSLFHSDVETSGFRINEDLLMNFLLFREAKKSIFEDFCPYHYMVRSGSAANTRNRECHYTDPIAVRKQICDMTKDVPKLHSTALKIYIRSLISGITQKAYQEISNHSKQELKQILRQKHKQIPRKERYMGMLAAYCKPLYRVIRWGYDAVTGVNHKYDLE